VAKEDLAALCRVLELRLALALRPALAHHRRGEGPTSLESIATAKATQPVSVSSRVLRLKVASASCAISLDILHEIARRGKLHSRQLKMQARGRDRQ